MNNSLSVHSLTQKAFAEIDCAFHLQEYCRDKHNSYIEHINNDGIYMHRYNRYIEICSIINQPPDSFARHLGDCFDSLYHKLHCIVAKCFLLEDNGASYEKIRRKMLREIARDFEFSHIRDYIKTNLQPEVLNNFDNYIVKMNYNNLLGDNHNNLVYDGLSTFVSVYGTLDITSEQKHDCIDILHNADFELDNQLELSSCVDEYISILCAKFNDKNNYNIIPTKNINTAKGFLEYAGLKDEKLRDDVFHCLNNALFENDVANALDYAAQNEIDKDNPLDSVLDHAKGFFEKDFEFEIDAEH